MTTKQKTKIIPWYRMMWFVKSQDPDESVDLMCVDTWLIARYLTHQFGECVYGGVFHGLTSESDFKFDSALEKWRNQLTDKQEDAPITFGEILKSMTEFQLNKLRKR